MVSLYGNWELGTLGLWLDFLAWSSRKRASARASELHDPASESRPTPNHETFRTKLEKTKMFGSSR